MNFYPVLLNLKNKDCLIIGGGRVAERKAISLLKAGANVSLLSPRITDRLQRIVRKGGVKYIPSDYDRKFLKKTFLVIVATDNHGVNTKICQQALKRNILVNCVDSPELCNFIVPAVFRRGDILVAVSTSGKAPGLAKKIRDDLKKIINRDYLLKLRVIEKVRRKIKKSIPSVKKRKVVLKKLVRLNIDELRKDEIIKRVLK